MTEYWFSFFENKPQGVYRIVAEEGKRYQGEYFDFIDGMWKPSETIDRYIYFGEIGYERTTEEDALRFIRSSQL
jgi:hypothetical protein